MIRIEFAYSYLREVLECRLEREEEDPGRYELEDIQGDFGRGRGVEGDDDQGARGLKDDGDGVTQMAEDIEIFGFDNGGDDLLVHEILCYGCPKNRDVKTLADIKRWDIDVRVLVLFYKNLVESIFSIISN